MSTPAKSAPARRNARGPHRFHFRTPQRQRGFRGRELDDPSLYINRELSLLDFQRRVLEEAQDSRNPVLERLMFLSFVGSNIDEFFMVRVAGLMRQSEKGVVESAPDGMTPAEQLRAIRASVIRLFRSAHDCWTKELVPALDEAGIHILNYCRSVGRAAGDGELLLSGRPSSLRSRRWPSIPDGRFRTSRI